MKLRKINASDCSAAKSARGGALNPDVSRRKLLAAAGLGLGAAALAPSLLRQAQAQGAGEAGKSQMIKTICSNCATGCGFIGEVKNDVWVGQEPWFEHPINQGSLCSKGAAAREHVNTDKRLRYPMKLEGGKWKRLSWETAMSEISAKLADIRAKHGPDALMILGSAHHNNETCYALRKFSAFWGSNNIDHQARI